MTDRPSSPRAGSFYATICTLGGLGWQKTAPGTWGSGVGLLVAAGLVALFGSIGLILATFAGFAFGVWACDHYEAETGTHDTPEIIIDEVVGQWISLVPVAVLGGGWFQYGIAFVLFRLFDIFKPGPIDTLDKTLKGGLGTMADDLLAGLCTAIVLWLLMRP